MIFRIQWNGKLVATIVFPTGTSREDIEAAAVASPTILERLDGRSPRKVVYVTDQRVNLVNVIA